MRKNALIAVSTCITVIGGAAAAHAQVYQDLRGQLMRLTGTLTTTGTISVLGDTVATVNSTVISEVPPLPSPSGNTSYSPPSFYQWGTTGPSDDSALSASIPLGSITAGSSTIALPNLTLTGSFNRTTGAFQASGDDTVTVKVPFTADGDSGTITVSNPSISYVGTAIGGAGELFPNTVTIASTQPAPLNIGLSGTINLGFPLGNQTISFNSFVIQYTTWTMTAVPGPDSAVVLLAGVTMGVGFLRRRTRSNRTRVPIRPTGPPGG